MVQSIRILYVIILLQYKALAIVGKKIRKPQSYSYLLLEILKKSYLIRILFGIKISTPKKKIPPLTFLPGNFSLPKAEY